MDGQLLALNAGGSPWAYSIGLIWVAIGAWVSAREMIKGRRRTVGPGHCVLITPLADGASHCMFELDSDARFARFLTQKTPAFAVGDPVTLSYDPQDTGDVVLAEERSGLDAWKGVLFISPIGLVVLLLTWVTFSG
ncbi:hypothetical protein [Streptomyces sp. SID11385]|uniref:hypothetical protein n=1 Tax=Streptomyces sp. SID11385 TaxID=2706031 RepID=UPI0013C8D8C1|nr:hypothetical protein [Streptomyces sp. SID11385]NEA37793.1 hypothetical protein [Streptomyces sp. SID11385]